MTDMQKFNEFLIKVVEADKVSIRRKILVLKRFLTNFKLINV